MLDLGIINDMDRAGIDFLEFRIMRCLDDSLQVVNIMARLAMSVASSEVWIGNENMDCAAMVISHRAKIEVLTRSRLAGNSIEVNHLIFCPLLKMHAA